MFEDHEILVVNFGPISHFVKSDLFLIFFRNLALAIHDAEIISFLHVLAHAVSFFARPLDLVTPVWGKNSKNHVVRNSWEQTAEEAPVRRHPGEGFVARGICWLGAFGVVPAMRCTLCGGRFWQATILEPFSPGAGLPGGF